MTNAIYTKPFTQIVEDTMYEMREANFADPVIEKKYQRKVNDIYQQTIPGEFAFWDFLKKQGTITLQASLSTGTVAITTNTTSVTHSVGGWTTNQYANFYFTVPATNETYLIVSNTASVLTLATAYIGDTVTAATFKIYRTLYSVASDYEFMTTEPGFSYKINGGNQYLDWPSEDEWASLTTTSLSTVPMYVREHTERTSTGLTQIEVEPPVSTARILRYEYYRALPQLREFVTGTASTTAASTTVTTSADYSAYVSAGQYFRVDSDGLWIRIASVSGATITLDSAYPATYAAKTYTICDAPEVPPSMQMALFYGACMLIAQEQADTNAASLYGSQYKNVISNVLSKQNKKRYGRKVLKFSTSPRTARLGTGRVRYS